MTNDQINKVIAKECGWKALSRKVFLNDEGYFVMQHAQKPPDYCNDLNAMHEAQAKLNEHEFVDYIWNIMHVCHEPMQSTARQRAEAFLRTLGKWEETR